MRVLADRLWPRGIAKADARVGRWMPHLAPTTALRRWYGHDPARWDEFARAYERELSESAPAADAMDQVRELLRQGPVLLTTATTDLDLSHLVVLARLLAA